MLTVQRDRDEADAAMGHPALLDRTAAAVAHCRELLTAGTAAAVVDVPWLGWALRRPDFLLTRLVEVVVHTTDLTVSLDVPAPVLDEPVFGPVRGLLARLAVARHGQTAVVDALTRRERAGGIAAF